MQVEYAVRGGRPVLHVFPWGDSKRALVRELGRPYYDVQGFEPYFFIHAGDELPKGVVRIEDGFTAIDGTPLKKVTCHVPAEVPRLREGHRHYEADVLFPQRYVIDRVKDVPHSEPDVMYIDIEMAARTGLPDPVSPKDPIIAISTYNSFYRRFWEFAWHPDWPESVDETRSLTLFRCHDEKTMLEAFVRHVGKAMPDVWTGWNVVNFDVMCILGRLVKNQMRPGALSPLGDAYIREPRTGGGRPMPVIQGVALFDLLTAYRAFWNHDFDSLSLEATAQRELGVGKRPMDKARIAETWDKNPVELLDYCRTDVELIVRIDRKLDLLGFYTDMHEGTGVLLADLLDIFKKKLHGGHIVETVIMRNSPLRLFSHEHARPAPPLVGADQFPPEKGLHKNVISLDDSSKYPSIITTFNMSNDTLIEEEHEDHAGHIHMDKACFERHEDKLGEIPRIVELMFERKQHYHELRERSERGTDEYKQLDRRRYTYKQILNAFQGTFSQPSSRFFNADIAHDITWAGREMLYTAGRIVNESGYKLVGGHTDSVYFTVKTDKLKDQLRIGTEVSDAINAEYRKWAGGMGVSAPWVRLKSELADISKTAFFASKTYYAKKLVWKGDAETGKATTETEIAGFQSKRSDYPPILRSMLGGFLEQILDGKDPGEVGQSLVSQLTSISRGEVPVMDVAIPKGLGKAIGSYKNHSPWDTGAAWANRNLKTVRFTTGSKPKLLYVKRVPPPLEPTRVVCIESEGDLPPGVEVDWRLMAEKVREGFRSASDALGLEFKTFLSDQQPLEAWM